MYLDCHLKLWTSSLIDWAGLYIRVAGSFPQSRQQASLTQFANALIVIMFRAKLDDTCFSLVRKERARLQESLGYFFDVIKLKRYLPD